MSDVEHEGLTAGDYGRYALLALFGSLVVLIGLGDTDHAFVYLAAFWSVGIAAGLLAYAVVRRRS